MSISSKSMRWCCSRTRRASPVVCRKKISCFTKTGSNRRSPTSTRISFRSLWCLLSMGPACPHPIDVWSDEAHRAAREAIDSLKPVDEIAVMAFTDTTKLIQPFTRNRIMIENALNTIPPPAKTTNVAHCFNLMLPMPRSTCSRQAIQRGVGS